ncbi:Protein of unknown function [Cotesia congregata]|uniref:Uncharacterized protein n=1 Tax=Cotesia congregata TaxID=51543 RepID=A0A8J2HCA3_COTCN|nr:Protein of unknown function [Cotesia congregata]
MSKSIDRIIILVFILLNVTSYFVGLTHLSEGVSYSALLVQACGGTVSAVTPLVVDSQLKTPQHRQAATTGTTQRTVDLTRIYTDKSLKIPPQLWHPNHLINPIKVY